MEQSRRAGGIGDTIVIIFGKPHLPNILKTTPRFMIKICLQNPTPFLFKMFILNVFLFSCSIMALQYCVVLPEKKFIYFWLYWVFVAECGLSPIAVNRGYSLAAASRLLTVGPLSLQSPGSRVWTSAVVVHRLNCL